MKNTITIIFLFIFFFNSFSQVESDSLILKEYIKCKPNFDYLDLKKNIFKHWGVKLIYIFAKDDYDFINHPKENSSTHKDLANKFGDNWEVTFKNELFLNERVWFLECNNKKDLKNLENLTLSVEKGSSNIKFNSDRTFTLWTDFRIEKDDDYGEEILTTPYLGNYTLKENTILLKFDDNTELHYDYEIVKSKIKLKMKK